jgi:hypothetical protein
MRIHGNQMDAILQINALAAAAKTEAKKEAERTRKKLMERASALAGEYEDGADCVVSLSGDRSPEEDSNSQTAHGQDAQQQEEQAGQEGDDTFSHWA